jgi:D-alanyl-D-alanine carboxypeptidase/D-alanyl-D-alanine-endopeptidase (penicillin-binding protein 4)
VRRFLLPLVLIVLAVGLGLAAWTMEEPEDAPAATPIDVAATPVLSPRRMPLWLLQPAGDERLRLAVQPVIDQSPADTCLVVDDHGRRIVDQQADLAVVPASNLKIVTAWAALEVLGGDATYHTSVAAAADPVDGVIDGDVWLIGGGDPVLTTGDYLGSFETEPAHTSMEALADAVVDAGVTTITGNVIGDDSKYDGLDTVPDWPVRDYGTTAPGPLDALEVNRGYSSYATEPDAELVPQASSDAPALASQRLIELLEERGVDVQGANGSDVAPEGTTEIAGIDSPPLTEIAQTMLTESDNTISELFLKEMAVHEGEPGSTAAGLEVLRQVVADSGLPTDGLVFADGSGLHGGDRLTCGFLAALLDRVGPGSTIDEGLPIAGETGTLADRLEGAAAGHVRAKTGSLDESTALSGFAETRIGDDLTFAYIANAAEVPESVLDLQEILASVLVGYPEGPSPADVSPEDP